MSATENHRTEERTIGANISVQKSDSARLAIQRAKAAVLFENVNQAGEHGRLLRLILNEAEALAWQTEFPHLVFPELAREKAQAAVLWHRRQRSLRPSAKEVAFAE